MLEASSSPKASLEESVGDRATSHSRESNRPPRNEVNTLTQKKVQDGAVRRSLHFVTFGVRLPPRHTLTECILQRHEPGTIHSNVHVRPRQKKQSPGV